MPTNRLICFLKFSNDLPIILVVVPSGLSKGMLKKATNANLKILRKIRRSPVFYLTGDKSLVYEHDDHDYAHDYDDYEYHNINNDNQCTKYQYDNSHDNKYNDHLIYAIYLNLERKLKSMPL